MIVEQYISQLASNEQAAFKRVLDISKAQVPDAKEGLSYGMPSLKYKGRPLIGFSSNRYGLNIYPFDPRIITELEDELKDFEIGKGVIRFTIDNQLPEKTILLILELRMTSLNK